MIDVKTTGANVAMIAGAVGWVYAQFTPAENFNRHVAEARTGTILDLKRALANVEPGPYRDTLCETLEAELASVCIDSPEHPFCLDRHMILEDSGC